jgi:RNA polymerase sigma factor (sigma-70 family)
MVPSEPAPPGALVEALRRGDPDAFDQVYASYQPRIYAFLVRLTARPWLAEELLQETFFRLARHARRLEPESDLGAWLFAVARNLYRSHRRWAVLDEQRLRQLFGLGRGHGHWPLAADEEAESAEMLGRLEESLESLPLGAREVLLLCGVEGLEPRAAAAVLGLRPEALRQRLSRARAMLRAKLGALEMPAATKAKESR